MPETLFSALKAGALAFDSRPTAEAALDAAGYFGQPGEGGWPAALRAAAESDGPPCALRAFGGCVSYLRRLLLDVHVR